MEKVRGECMICEQQVNKNSKDAVEMQSKLDVFFLLRKVVEVPDSLLLKFLEETSRSAGMTCCLFLCERCQGIVKECRDVYEQFSVLQWKWNECKATVVNTVKEKTWMPPPPEDGQSFVLDLQRETRRFAVSQANSFPQGLPSRVADESESVRTADQSPSSSSPGEEGGNGPLPINRETTPEEIRPTTSQQQQGIPRERSHPCPRCPKKYVNPLLLQKHLLAHPEIDRTRRTKTAKPLLFKCGECGNQFSSKQSLGNHELVHTGEKPHECKLCNQRFRHPHNLNRHMKAHLGEKHFKCETCGKAFVTKRELINHRTVHTGEKPWKCNLCPQAYRRHTQLSTHKKVHQTSQIPANISI